MDMNGHKLQLLASLHVLLDERNVTRGGAWHARFDNDPGHARLRGQLATCATRLRRLTPASPHDKCRARNADRRRARGRR